MSIASNGSHSNRAGARVPRPDPSSPTGGAGNMAIRSALVEKLGRRRAAGMTARCVAVLAAAGLAFGAGTADAAVTQLNGWTRITGGTTGTSLSGTFTPSAGSGSTRMMLVSIQIEYATATAAFSPTVTFGGQTVTQWVSTNTTASRQKVWFGYLDEAGLDAAALVGNTLSVTLPAGPSASVVYAAVYDGVLQSSPVVAGYSAFQSSDTAASTANFGGNVTYDAGSMVIYGAGVRSGTGMTPPAGYQNPEPIDGPLEGTRFWPSMSYIARASGGSSNDTVNLGVSNRYAIAAVSLRPALGTNTIQLVTGTNPPGSTTVCPGDTVYADQFGFTVTGTADRVSGLTVSGLGTTTPIASIKVSNDAGTTLYSAAPTGDSQSFTFTSPDLAAPVGTTSYRLYFDVKSHAALAGAPAAVSPIVASYTSTNSQTPGTDTASSFTVDNTAQANVGTSSAGTPTSSSLTLSLGASAGLTEYVVWARKGSAPTDNPTDGQQYSQGTPDPANSWVAYVGSASNPTISGLDPSSTYYFRIFARDACFNYSTTAATASGTTSAAPGTITIATGSDPSPNPIIAPGATGPIDAFTLQTSANTATLSTVTVSIPSNASNLTSISIQNVATCDQPPPYYGSFANPTASNIVSVSNGLTAGPSVGPSVYVCGTAKGHSAVVGSPQITATVTVVAASGYTSNPTNDTAGATLTIDNTAPGAPTSLGASVGDAQLNVRWTNPVASDLASVIVVHDGASPITWTPTDGLTYAAGQVVSGTVTIGCATATTASGAQASCTDAYVVNGNDYHLVAFALDQHGNYSPVSAGAGPFRPTAIPPEGDAVALSEKPVISIVNPAKNAVVKAPFRVQARVFSPNTAGGATQLLSSVVLLVDGTPNDMTHATEYGGVTDRSGVWYFRVPTLAAGAHTLRATATNAAGTVYSAVVDATVLASGSGDGNLLVRDNASQLCTDCHAVGSHSSESTGNKWGSWATVCRDCHTPHGTKNISLVGEQITPPALQGPQTPKTVVFRNKSGWAAQSYASTANNGPCQVCHTRTGVYRSDGTDIDTNGQPIASGGHNPNDDCATCHKHGKGFMAVCTDCHGDATRTKDGSVVGNVDPRFTAAPPMDTNKVWTPTVKTGAHLAHVNKGTLRTHGLACADCHPSPNTHQGTRDAAWSTTATGYGAVTPQPLVATGYTADWENTPTCTNWCHGAGMPNGGGTVPSPNWTLGSSQAACSAAACHATPPAVAADHHPQNDTCSACHGTGYTKAALDANAKGTHVNGVVNKPANGCTACHGELAGLAGAAQPNTNLAAAPGFSATAVDTHGNTNATSPLPNGVGVHQAHVNPAASQGLMSPKGCQVCHYNTALAPVYADGDTTHANGSVNMAWSSPANASSVTPTWSGGSCTNYCHSNARPLGGALSTPSFSWTSTTNLGCTACHDGPGVGTALSHAHQVHTGTYGYGCVRCHTATATGNTSIVSGGGAHVDGSRNVDFDSSGPDNHLGGYNYGTYQCSNTYCHSNGTDRTAPYTSGPSLAWNASSGCSSCHDSGVAMATGSHGAHVNASATFGKNYTCENCHFTTTNDGLGIASTTNHVNWQANVDGNPSGVGGATLSYDMGGSPRSCSTYCHSSGQATPVTYNDMTWGTTSFPSACSACHGRSSPADPLFVANFGAPNYPNGGPGAASANSHRKHVKQQGDCYTCHKDTVTSAGNVIATNGGVHLDTYRNVAFDPVRVPGSPAYTQGGATPKQCTSVSCHGAGAPQWGGTVKCSDCHVGTNDTDSFQIGTAGIVSSSEWTGTGHGQAAVGLGSVNPCLYCHDDNVLHQTDALTNPFRLRGALAAANDGSTVAYASGTNGGNDVCLNCHGNGKAGVDPDPAGTDFARVTAATKVESWHAGSGHTGDNGGTRCWDCHDPHGDGFAKMIGKTVVRTSADAFGFSATRVAVTFSLSPTPVGGDYASSTDATKICNACHTTAGYHYRSSAPIGDSHMATVDCTKCHAHSQGVTANAFLNAPAGTCNACHKGPTTAPASSLAGSHAKHYAVTTATTYTNTTDNTTPAAYGFACAKCHPSLDPSHMNDATHQGTAASRLVAEVNAALGFTAGGTFASDVGQSGLEFQTSTGNCTTASACHSNASPLGGTAQNATVAWGDATWTDQNRCQKCHQMAADNTGLPASTNLSHAHYVHATTYAFNCSQCHNGVATGKSDYPTTPGVIADKTMHVNGQKTVAFDSTYNPGSPGWSGDATHQCTNTYCHSNGTNPASPPANGPIAWNGSVTCGSCHNEGTAMATQSHGAHVNQSSYLGTNFRCYRCHSTTVTDADSPAISGYSVHVDRTPTVSMSNGGTWAAGTHACTSTYCHSDGREAGASSPTYVDPPAWNAAPGGLANTCKTCHGAESGGTLSLAGEPRYTNDPASDSTRNSHAAHVPASGAAASCVNCHDGTVNASGALIAGTLHINGVGDVSAGPGKKIGSYTQTGETCSNVTCHGGRSAQWGGTIGCRDCHGQPTGQQDVNDFTYTDAFNPGTVSKIDMDDWLVYGHGATAAFAESGNGNPTPANFDDGGAIDGCQYCHSRGVAHSATVNPFRLINIGTGTTAAEKVGVCTACHAVGSLGVTVGGVTKNATKKISATHYGAQHATTVGGMFCWDCHDPHGDYNSAKAQPLAYMIQEQPTQAHSGSAGWGVPTLLAPAPDFRKEIVAPTTSFDWGDYVSGTLDGTTYRGICQVCHTATDYGGPLFRQTTWAANETGHNPSTRCTECHTHQQGTTDAFKGSGSCSTCHLKATADNDSVTWGDGQTGTINEAEWTTYGHGRSTAFLSGNGAAGFDSQGALAMDRGCAYCHDGNATAHNVSTNYFRLANTSLGQNGTCLVCHGSAYAGYDPDGAATDYAPKNGKDVDEWHYGSKHGGTNHTGGQFCWDCHDPHGDNSALGNDLWFMLQRRPVEQSDAATMKPVTLANAIEFRPAVGGNTTLLDFQDYTGGTLDSSTTGLCRNCHDTVVAHFNKDTLTGNDGHNYTATTTNNRCTDCHKHVKGFGAECNTCHGTTSPRTPAPGADANLDFAPPLGLLGETATTERAVGAHISHVNQTTLRSNALPCAECHNGATHNGTKEVLWGTLATTGSVTPNWSGTGCSLTYCHGNFKNGNDNVTYTTPGAPTSLAFSSVTNTTLTLGWSGASGAVLYKIERAPDVSGVPGTFVQIGTSSTTSYADGGLSDGTTYWYRVRAWNPSGDGAYSANASQKTNGGLTPTEFDMVGEASGTNLGTDGSTNVLTATTSLTPTTGTTFTNRNVTTQNFVYTDVTRRRDSLTANMTAGTTYNYIDLYSAALTASNNTVGASVQMSIDLYMLGTGTGSGTWAVTLYEYTSGGVSTQKGTCTATYNAAVTTFQTVVCTVNNTQWTAAVGSRIKVRIQIVVPSGASWGRPALLWGATRVTSGTMAGQTYFTASIGTPTTVPPAPTGTPTLSSGTVTDTTVALSWTSVTGATSYIVERGLGATPASWTQIAQPTGLTLVDPALTASTIYSYRVRATNAGGSGPNSTPNRTVTTAAAPPWPPVTSWTGTFTPGSTSLTCSSCHGDPPAGTHPAVDTCSTCHPGYSDKSAVPQTVDKNVHINGVLNTGDCVGCHSSAIGPRRDVVAEFGLKWSHKRSAGGTVTKWDCVVCHMEGDPATGDPVDGVHMNGYVNLRDPDTGNNIKGVTFSAALGGTAAGNFTETAGDLQFTAFSRDLSVPLESDPNAAIIEAIEYNQCLKCHDGDGAAAFNPGNPLAVMATAGGVTRSAAIPFGTAISYASVPANEGGTTTVPSGIGVTANGTPGGVIAVKTSLLTTNSSYHPVLGRNNNSFVYGARAAAPWSAGIPGRTQGSGSVNNFGYLISCWDCHAHPGDTAIGATVTAHGATETLRGTATVSGTPAAGTNQVTLCIKCHAGYDTCNSDSHCANSAMNTSGASPMGTYMRYGCNLCHSSGYATGTQLAVIRPTRAEDVHGENALPPTGTKLGRWSGAATGNPPQVDARPYAFIRNTQPAGLRDHQPHIIGGSTYTAQCYIGTASPCSRSAETYTVGGTY